jgi:hypothetical protein
MFVCARALSKFSVNDSARSVILHGGNAPSVTCATTRRTPQVTLSSLFKWYSSDFGDTDEAVLKLILRYLPVGGSAARDLRALLSAPEGSYLSPRVRFAEYDWGANEGSSASGPRYRDDTRSPAVVGSGSPFLGSSPLLAGSGAGGAVVPVTHAHAPAAYGGGGSGRESPASRVAAAAAERPVRTMPERLDIGAPAAAAAACSDGGCAL